MQKYGIIKDGKLLASDQEQEGYKPVEFAPIPDFDQTTQFVMQGAITEDAEKIYVDVMVQQLEISDEVITDEFYDDPDVSGVIGDSGQ